MTLKNPGNRAVTLVGGSKARVLAEIIIIVLGLCCGALAGRWAVATEQQKRELRLSSSERERARLKAMLDVCCRKGLRAIAIDVARGNVSPVRFVSTGDATLELETTGEGGDQECWSRGSLVAVQFNLEGRSRIFVSPLEEATPGTSGTTYLRAFIPRQIADHDQRAVFRTNLSGDEPLSASVLHGDRDFSAQVDELSLGGVTLVCASSDIKPIKQGDELEVLLVRGDHSVQRTGRVDRAQGTQLRVKLGIVADDELPPEQAAYLELVRAVLSAEAA